MTCWMYILECADGSYYTGSTIDLFRRLSEHMEGLGANHTRKNLPVKLVYAEEFNSIDHAYNREKQVQGWNRQKKEALINGHWDKLHGLAECRNNSHHENNNTGGFDSAQPPSKGTQPPSKSTQAPSKSTQAPSKGTQPPSKGTQPPAKGALQPSKGTELSTKGAQPPAKGDLSPAKGHLSPGSGTDKKELSKPTERSRSREYFIKLKKPGA